MSGADDVADRRTTFVAPGYMGQRGGARPWVDGARCHRAVRLACNLKLRKCPFLECSIQCFLTAVDLH